MISKESNNCLLLIYERILFMWLHILLDMLELCMVSKKKQKPAGILFMQWNDPSYLIKVRYDLIEQTETLQSFLIDIRLGIKLFKVRDGGEHHTHRLVRLVIKVLIRSNGKITAGRVVAGDRKNTKVCGFDVSREDLWAERWHRV